MRERERHRHRERQSERERETETERDGIVTEIILLSVDYTMDPWK